MLLNQTIETQKWSCQICTYLNWPKSIKCVQCYTPKSILTTPSNDTNFNLIPQHANSASSISNAFASETTGGDCSINSQTNNALKPQENARLTSFPGHTCDLSNISCKNNEKSPDHDGNKADSNEDMNKSASTECLINKININVDTKSVKFEMPIQANNSIIANSEAIKKWSCASCTYQNWPKSQRCVMCHVQRNASTFSNKGLNSKPNINTNKNLKINNNAIMNKNILINNNISNAANSASNTNNYNLIKTLQLQIDRLFLSACEGIVDADMSHLFRYINAGGDLTRYLTSDEVCLLKIIFFCLRLDRKSLRA